MTRFLGAGAINKVEEGNSGGGEEAMVVAIDLEAIQAPEIDKQCGHCVVVSEINTEMKVLFDTFGVPRLYQWDSFEFMMSCCSEKKCLAQQQRGEGYIVH